MSSFTQLLVLTLLASVFWIVFGIFIVRRLQTTLHATLSAHTASLSDQLRRLAEIKPDVASEPVPSASRSKPASKPHQPIESVRERVRATAEEQSRQIEMLQLELQSDEVTGLATRRYFINELRRCLRAQDDDTTAPLLGYGHVLILRQRDLAAINLKDRKSTRLNS